MKEIEILSELQKKDARVVQLKKMLELDPEEIKNLEKGLHQLEKKLEDMKNSQEEIKKKQRVYESEVQDNNARIKKNEEKIKSIKSNKEYQAILKENEDAENRNSKIEEEIIKCMMSLDDLQVSIKEATKELSVVEKQVKEEIQEKEKQTDEAKKEYDLLISQREDLLNQIQPALLKHYNAIKNQSNGIAIALVKGGTCTGCHRNIPPQMYIELQKTGDKEFCPNCQRIIYWKPEIVSKEE